MHYRDQSSRTECAEAPNEHVTGITVRHEGKPSGFGPFDPVGFDIGVILQGPKVEKVQRHFPLPVSFAHPREDVRLASDSSLAARTDYRVQTTESS